MLPDDETVLQGFARSIIRRKARYVARCDGFTARDVRDIEQELRRRLLQNLSQFDPAQGHINVFITVVVKRSAAMLIRERVAKKRAATVQSLDTLTNDAGEPDELLDYRDDSRGAERFDLTHDLAAVLTALPDDLRELAEQLKVQSVAEAARDRKVPRTSLLRQVERLRRCLEDAGMRIYT